MGMNEIIILIIIGLFAGLTGGTLGIGGGIIVYNDDMGGAVSQTGVELTGSYQLRLPNADAVSFGLSLQGTQFGFDSSDLNVWDQDDPSLNGSLETTFGVDASTGMMIYGTDYFFLDFVINNVKKIKNFLN